MCRIITIITGITTTIIKKVIEIRRKAAKEGVDGRGYPPDRGQVQARNRLFCAPPAVRRSASAVSNLPQVEELHTYIYVYTYSYSYIYPRSHRIAYIMPRPGIPHPHPH